MPRYYFHYRTEEALIRDPAGSEHPDLEAAERNAAEIGKAIVDRVAGQGGDMEAPRSIEITDGDGVELLYVVFWAGPKAEAGPGTPVTPVQVH